MSCKYAHSHLDKGIMCLPFCALYDVMMFATGDKKARPWISVSVLAASAIALFSLRMAFTGASLPIFLVEDNPASFSDSLVTRALTYTYLYSLNAWFLLYPNSLCFDWQMSSIPLVESLSDVRALVGVAFTGIVIASCGVLSYCVFLRKASSIVVLSVGLIILPFLPASNLLFRVGFVLADRVLYMPSMGYCILVAVTTEQICRFFSLNTKAKQILTTVTLVILALYTTKSIMRTDDWRTKDNINRAGLDVNPRCAKCIYNIGNAYKERGEYDHAESYYRRVLELWPDHPSSHNNIGVIKESDGKLDDAEHHYRAALAISPHHPSSHFNLGNVLRAKGVYDAAKHHYERAMQIKPNDPSFPIGLAELYYLVNQLDLCFALYEKTITAFPHNVLLHANYGITLMKAGKRKQAEKHLRTALEPDPASDQAFDALVQLLQDTNRNDEAQKLLNDRVKSGRASGSDLTRSAAIAASSGSYKEAIRLYERVLESGAVQANIVYDLAKVYASSPGHGEKAAEKLFARYLTDAREQKDWELVARYGIFLVGRGRIHDANKMFTEAHQLSQGKHIPGSKSRAFANLLYNFAVNKLNSGQERDAHAILLTSLEYDSSSADVLFALGNIERTTDVKSAEQRYRAAILAAPDRAEIYGNLGALLHTQKSYGEAKIMYKKALEIDPTSKSTRDNLDMLANY